MEAQTRKTYKRLSNEGRMLITQELTTRFQNQPEYFKGKTYSDITEDMSELFPDVHIPPTSINLLHKELHDKYPEQWGWVIPRKRKASINLADVLHDHEKLFEAHSTLRNDHEKLTEAHNTLRLFVDTLVDANSLVPF